MSEHDQTLELMPDYALGMASPDERKLVERHIAACRTCYDELKRMQYTADALPEGIVLVDPPARLKASILQQAEASLAGTAPKNLEQARQADDRLSWWQKLSRIWRTASPAWGLAGLTLILVLAVSNALLLGRLGQNENASMLRTVGLHGGPAAPESVGTLVVSLDGEHGTLVVDALSPLDATHEYQVWLVKNNEWTSGGVFSVDDEGYGAKWVHAPEALASYDSVWLTAEPKGGSPAPTGELILGGDL